jgi:hypothetical protein
MENTSLQQFELSSGFGRWLNNEKKGIRLCKEDFIIYCRYCEAVMNPLPGYD